MPTIPVQVTRGVSSGLSDFGLDANAALRGCLRDGVRRYGEL